MTTEDDFQRVLDAQPTDRQTRGVFADWLDECGDPRADGYRRCLARPDVRPFRDPDSENAWAWFNGEFFHRGEYAEGVDHAFLPLELFAVLEGGTQLRRNEPTDEYGGSGWRDYPSRRAAEDALARAFARLPQAVRDRVIVLIETARD